MLLVMHVPEGPDLRAAVARRLGVPAGSVGAVEVVRRSLDARHGRRRVVLNLRVALDPEREAEVLERSPGGVRRWTLRDSQRLGGALAQPPPAPRRLPGRPIVVGMGPAGLFAALRLAERGTPALVLERGEPVEDRVRRVRRQWRDNRVDPESNLVFGEGGAGTFSDGKIYTRRRDGELGYVFQRLVDAGADPGIFREAWPHLGTDRIRAILPALRRRLLELGCPVRFRSRVVGLHVERGRVRGVRLAGGEEIAGWPVVFAPGHSARDSARLLVEAGARAVLRPISVGARAEHPQALVDRALLGADAGRLPAASYRLAFHGAGCDVHSFCMCPGGLVVPASDRPDRVVVNGMSFAGRSSPWANAALITLVPPERYPGDDPLAGFRFQDAIERACYEAGGATLAAPAQRIPDFLARRPSTDLPRTSYPHRTVPADLRELLPLGVCEALEAAIRAFDRRIPGYAGPDGVLIAPESRTTSPVRFPRRPDRSVEGVAGLYVAGEGAGFAGGIASAALDGVRVADAILAGVSGS